MFENPFKREFDPTILTDKIFSHCETITEYDGCMRCQFLTLILLIVQAHNNKQ
jgi:hypothetical protein